MFNLLPKEKAEILYKQGKMPEWFFSMYYRTPTENLIHQMEKTREKNKIMLEERKQKNIEEQYQKQLEKEIEKKIDKEIIKGVEEAIENLFK